MKSFIIALLMCGCCHSVIALDCEEGTEPAGFGISPAQFCATPEEMQELNRQFDEEGLTKEEVLDAIDYQEPEPEPEPKTDVDEVDNTADNTNMNDAGEK